jgi:acetylglutamate kinase
MAKAVRPLTVLKIGGELLEPGCALAAVTSAVRALVASGPLLVVHGGGREIDADMARRGLVKQAVDGLRVTDVATLESVIAVLAGAVNTRLVAALVDLGVPAVGLTGADASTITVERARPYLASDGSTVDLGEVGEPVAAGPPRLLRHLLAGSYVPVLASIGVGGDGALFNVNADTLAAHVAVALGAARLVIAGSVAGVLDRTGAPIGVLTPTTIRDLVGDGTVSAGMVAKLVACQHALDGGVAEIAIVDGRTAEWLSGSTGTHLVRDQGALSRSR